MGEGRPAANDEDRLPWLEPYRDTPAGRARQPQPAPAPRARRSGRGGLFALGGVGLVAAAIAGGYWLGQREAPRQAPVQRQAPAPVGTASTQASLADNRPVTEAVSPPDAEAVEPAFAPAPRQAVPARKAKPKAAATKRARGRTIRSAGIERSRIEAVRREQEAAPRQSEPTAPPRVWPKMPSPGPAGQVIQLGAFSNPDRAYAAYRTRLARYPTLGRMPRVIVPVISKPNGRMLYVLRLGTRSRIESKRVCRNLRTSGDHCLVIG